MFSLEICMIALDYLCMGNINMSCMQMPDQLARIWEYKNIHKIFIINNNFNIHYIKCVNLNNGCQRSSVRNACLSEMLVCQKCLSVRNAFL